MNTPPPLDDFFFLTEHANLTEDVIYAFHPQENRLLYLSAAFERVWNMPRAAVDSDFTIILNTIHPDDRKLVENAIATIFHTKHILRLEFRLLLAEQAQKWISVNAHLTQHNDMDIIIGTASDITMLKDYGNSLYKYANKKNAILDILSHDLTTPIGNIRASAQLLAKQDLGSNQDTISKLLHIILSDCERCIKMIRDLINKEVLESSQAPLIMQRTDIIKRLTEVVEQYKHTYYTIEQKIVMESTCSSLHITVDDVKLIQIINNLLSNALKFTRPTDEIKVIVEDQETTVLLKVADTGIGIPNDLQPYIFDKLTKAGRPGIKGEPTTGLGLSIVKNIVEWHQGNIWFESIEGKGTTFFIELPKDKPYAKK